MAQGDVLCFNQFILDIGLELHQLETDVIKMGLVTAAVTPVVGDADPRWGAGGTTNYATNEVTLGGNYSAGGPAIANNTYTQATGVGTFDGDNIAIAQNAANPATARWGIIYNDTDAGKRVVGFLDLGGVTDLSAGDFSVTWDASGIFTLTRV